MTTTKMIAGTTQAVTASAMIGAAAEIPLEPITTHHLATNGTPPVGVHHVWGPRR